VTEARTPADVRAAVLAAREHGLPVAVRATGHGTVAPADAGWLVSTERMAGVRIDPDRRTATVGPGTRWADVIAAAAPYGLAPLSGSSVTVGVTGYTFGGGLGLLSRQYGFAADSLLRADLVIADGRLVTASADREPELFWALRGGGGNFGVATALEFRLYPVDEVYGGTAYFPLERANDVLARYRDWAAGAPEELTTAVVLLAQAPPAVAAAAGVTGPVLALRGLYAGPADEGVGALQPLSRAAGTPLAGGWRPMRYTDSGTLGGTRPQQFHRYADLPDAAIDAAVAAVGEPDTPVGAIEVRLWGGAMANPGPDAGPVGHRDVPFSVIVDGPDGTAAPLARYATGGRFYNFLHDPAATASAYDERDYRRLREIKRAYDPDNTFRLNLNIPPATPRRSS
jgi:FAD/FMN-containing dehydrogenase